MDDLRPRLATYTELCGWKEIQPLLLDSSSIVCSAHLGNWELLAAHFALVERVPVAAVARRLDEPRLNDLLVALRTSNGVETILREDPAAGRQMLRILKQPRGMLAMLVDQDTKVPSITVPFLGRPARTPVAPATLSVRRNLPLLVAYALRRPAGGLRLEIVGPFRARPGLGRDDAVRDLTTQANDVLSQAIRDNPTQWPWWHQRWRSGPKPDLDPDASIT
jgi:KDO2-lipid IV(A) lauroyltransferase